LSYIDKSRNAGAQKITHLFSQNRVDTQDIRQDIQNVTPFAIEFRNVEKSWPDANDSLFSNLSLAIRSGEIFALIGPSGHGKSTLLRMIAGLLEHDDGEVYFSGCARRDMTSAELLKLSLSMGMLFQRNALFDFLSAAENLAFPLRERSKFDAEEILRRVENGLDSVGLRESGHLFPSELSGGMQKRVGIARAHALNPKILLYDDPTAGLDPLTSRKIMTLIRELQALSQSTVVMITNDMNRAYQVADRIGFMSNGELIVTGSPEETRAHTNASVQQFIRGQIEGPMSLTPKNKVSGKLV
jgi:phospholipid/cholesterol/gamma-HCH transport system ATP-binding protein